VGSFNSSFTKSAFSSHQPYVTVTAAGEGMVAAAPRGYATISSTSAASAIVTGISALIKARFPELTPKQVAKALTSSTRFHPAGGQLNGSGHGTVDAAKALTAAAALAKPAPRRAGDGAVAPSPLPTLPPAVPQSSDKLAPKLEHAGILSLAVLVLLLVPILIYVIVRSRRRRERVVLEPPAPDAFSRDDAFARSVGHGGGSQADQMLEYFAAIPAEPSSGTRAAGGAWPGPRVSPGGPGPGYARGTGRFGEISATGEDLLPRREPPSPRSPLTPITRASAPRPPKVSGSPPWGPAPKPEGELPWAASPTPMGANRRVPVHNVPASAPAARSIWDTGAVSPPQLPMELVPSAGRPEPEPEAPGAADKPIYVWNPSANTETLPAQRHDPDGSADG
jgi:Subtilase family